MKDEKKSCPYDLLLLTKAKVLKAIFLYCRRCFIGAEILPPWFLFHTFHSPAMSSKEEQFPIKGGGKTTKERAREKDRHAMPSFPFRRQQCQYHIFNLANCKPGVARTRGSSDKGEFPRRPSFHSLPPFYISKFVSDTESTSDTILWARLRLVKLCHMSLPCKKKQWSYVCSAGEKRCKRRNGT